MSNKEIIIAITEIDHQLYDDILFNNFFEWCKTYSAWNIPIKILVNNESLYNWYSDQYKAYVEDAFVKDHKEYITTGHNDPTMYRELIGTYPAEIENFYPRVIIKMIKDTIKQYAK